MTTPAARFLTAFDRTFWVEDPADEHRRLHLTASDSRAAVRQLYPLRARLRIPLPWGTLPAGTIFLFARPRRVPNCFPIECVVLREGDLRLPDGTLSMWRTPHLSLSSEEAELLVPSGGLGNV